MYLSKDTLNAGQCGTRTLFTAHSEIFESKLLVMPCYIPGWFENFMDRWVSLDKLAHFYDDDVIFSDNQKGPGN